MALVKWMPSIHRRDLYCVAGSSPGPTLAIADSWECILCSCSLFSQSQILKKHFFKITFKYKSIIFTENSSANVHLKRWYLSTSPGNRSFVHFMWAEYNPPVEV